MIEHLHRYPPWLVRTMLAREDELLPHREWRRTHQLPRYFRWLDRW